MRCRKPGDWLDFGSGAGFPGLVTAIKYAGDADARVHLIEFGPSQMRLSANCHPRDIGACHRPLRQTRNDPAGFRRAHRRGQRPRLGAARDVLLSYAKKFIEKGATGVFSKGKQFESELTNSLTAGKYFITTMESQTCATARLVLVQRSES